MSVESEIDELIDDKINNFKTYELEEAVADCLEANDYNRNNLSEGLMDLLNDFPRNAEMRCELGKLFTNAIRQILHDETTMIMLRTIVRPPEETIKVVEPLPRTYAQKISNQIRSFMERWR